MYISPIKENEKSFYSACAKRFGTIFDTLDWLRIFSGGVRIYGIFDDGKRLFGGFYLYHRRYLFLKSYENPPYTPVMGFFFENRAKNKANATSFTKNVVDAVADFLDGLGGQIIMISVPRTLTDMQPFIWRKFKVVPHYTYIIDLSIPEESLLGNMSPERRNDIRRALNDGITTERILDYGIILDLVRKSFARQSRAVDSHYLEKILYEFARGENSFAIASFREGLPIAASFCIHDRRTAYYLLGGYDPEHRHHGAGALAVWEAIRHSKSLNLERFDFEGSMVKAVERYFRDFGGDLVPYYRVNKALLPLEILLKFRKRELF